MSDELKNCPHCGNSDHLKVTRVESETLSPDNFQVVCSWLSGGCGASGGVRRTEAEAIAAWNTRADEPQLIENAENYNLADDSEPQVIEIGEKYKSDDKPDSRERLEADVREWCATFPTWNHAKEFRETVFSWLDRQSAITERELCGRCSPYATAKDYLDTIDSLTAERDELKAELAECEYELAKCEHDWGELLDEKYRLKAERDELRAQLDTMRDVAREFRDERDALRDKLREKQHVCDVQRDSFLKLEAENAELRRMLSDAAEAI